MFWNKKANEKGLPDLPPMKNPSMKNSFSIPSDINMPEEEDDLSVEKHNLPAFPDSPMGRGFSQTAIKSAVSTNEEIDEDETYNLPLTNPREFKTVEIENPLLPPPERNVSFKKLAQSQESKSEIFVKIDKFNIARKSLSNAQEKIDEIGELLHKIRETRMREEQELTAWEKEVAAVKSKIQEVSHNIFEKL